jgi:hypothetical protein
MGRNSRAENYFQRDRARREERNVLEARQFAEQSFPAKKSLHNLRGIDGVST